MNCWQVSKRVDKERPYEDIPHCHQQKVDCEGIKKDSRRPLRSHTGINDQACFDHSGRNQKNEALSSSRHCVILL
jgi:hypothetical protein